MARSKEALLRRAEKRGRTVEQQRKADASTEPKQDGLSSNNHERPRDERLDEPGAWKCPACQNENFASRDVCRSTTCNEKRPPSVTVPPTRKRKMLAPPRSATASTEMKQLHWAQQASSDQVTANQQLRQRYMDGDTTLTVEETERAKVLIARDERKKQRKNARKEQKAASSANKATTEAPGIEKMPDITNTKPMDVKAQHKRNKALRKRFAKTNGEGMSDQDVARYHQLLARDERKRAEKEARKAAAIEKNKKRKREPADSPSASNGQSKVEQKATCDKENGTEKELTKDERKSLRRRFKKTAGEGMSVGDIKLAKSLIQKKKEKKHRRKTV